MPHDGAQMCQYNYAPERRDASPIAFWYSKTALDHGINVCRPHVSSLYDSPVSSIVLRLDLVGCGLWFLECGVVFRVDFEEVIEDDEEHGSASEEDGQRIKLGVRNHLGG